MKSIVVLVFCVLSNSIFAAKPSIWVQVGDDMFLDSMSINDMAYSAHNGKKIAKTIDVKIEKKDETLLVKYAFSCKERLFGRIKGDVIDKNNKKSSVFDKTNEMLEQINLPVVEHGRVVNIYDIACFTTLPSKKISAEFKNNILSLSDDSDRDIVGNYAFNDYTVDIARNGYGADTVANGKTYTYKYKITADNQNCWSLGSVTFRKEGEYYKLKFEPIGNDPGKVSVVPEFDAILNTKAGTLSIFYYNDDAGTCNTGHSFLKVYQKTDKQANAEPSENE